jgi:NAD(P)-dependent dehydrogenase (short-subunit alcohol dehydrogenase family)
MKILVTGGNKGLGQEIVNRFNATSISRSDGHDITKHAREIAEKSLDYDVFVNNAFDGPPQEEWANFGQVQVLHEVYTLWKANNKKGHIINIGSVGERTIVAPEPSFETYRVAKAALKHASLQSSRAFKDNLVHFKTTLLTLDRLDTELTRSRASWTGNGVDCASVCDQIAMILSLNSNSCIEEIVTSVNFNFDN